MTFSKKLWPFVMVVIVSLPNTSAGWEWINPVPCGNHLSCSFVSDTGNTYIGGDGGTLLRYDGQTWSDLGGAWDFDIRGIWGTDDSHIWAAAQSRTRGGAVLFFDGVRWLILMADMPYRLNDISGLSGSNIYIAGCNQTGLQGVLIHWNGSSWQVVDEDFGNGLTGVWAHAADDVLVCGREGFISHYDGNLWRVQNIPFQLDLNDIWGSIDSEAFAVGMLGTVVSREGGTWQVETLSSSVKLNGIHGNLSGNILICGDGGEIFERLDGLWRQAQAETDSRNLNTVFAGLVKTIVAGDSGAVYERPVTGRSTNHTADAFRSISSGFQTDIQAVHAISETDVIAAGSGGAVWRWNGSEWTDLHIETASEIRAVWAFGPDDIWIAGGNGLIAHRGSEGWTYQDLPVSTDLLSLWGDGPDCLFAAGREGRVLGWNGSYWSLSETGTSTDIYSLHGGSCHDIYAAGGGINPQSGIAFSIVLHYDGTGWTVLRGTPAVLTDIHQDEQGGLSVCGFSQEGVSNPRYTGHFFRWNGDDWTEICKPVDLRFWTLTCFRQHVLAGGDGGMIFDWDDRYLARQNSQTTREIRHMHSDPAGALFACGQDGMVLRWNHEFPDPRVPVETGAYLHLNQAHFSSGDRFDLSAVVVNHEQYDLTGDIFIALDVGGVEFWFWPSWVRYPEGLDFKTAGIDSAENIWLDLLSFTWPDTGSASGIRFWSFWISPDGIIGLYDWEEFSF